MKNLKPGSIFSNETLKKRVVTPKFWCAFRLTNMELSRILRVNIDYKLLVG